MNKKEKNYKLSISDIFMYFFKLLSKRIGDKFQNLKRNVTNFDNF